MVVAVHTGCSSKDPTCWSLVAHVLVIIVYITSKEAFSWSQLRGCTTLKTEPTIFFMIIMVTWYATKILILGTRERYWLIKFINVSCPDTGHRISCYSSASIIKVSVFMVVMVITCQSIQPLSLWTLNEVRLIIYIWITTPRANFCSWIQRCSYTTQVWSIDQRHYEEHNCRVHPWISKRKKDPLCLNSTKLIKQKQQWQKNTTTAHATKHTHAPGHDSRMDPSKYSVLRRSSESHSFSETSDCDLSAICKSIYINWASKL